MNPVDCVPTIKKILNLDFVYCWNGVKRDDDYTKLSSSLPGKLSN